MRIATRAALGFLVGLLAIVASFSHADGEAPTREIVETVLKASWNREATDFTPRAKPACTRTTWVIGR